MNTRINITYDKNLSREVVHVNIGNQTYRCPALIGKRYKITELLTAGGFGLLFVGRDKELFNKQVLIKANKYERRLFKRQRDKAVLKHVQIGRDRTEHEAKMLLQAHNRQISGTPVLLDKIVDIGLDLYGPHIDEYGNNFYYQEKDPQSQKPVWQEEPYLILSYINGQTVNDHLSNNKYFRANLMGNSKQLILQIARVLDRFHKPQKNDQGYKLHFIYQDLKPDNIIFTRENNLVLIDFGGFAVCVNNKAVKNQKLGTPGYRPPEFVNPDFHPQNIDIRADIFSLGATVYHLLAQKPPHQDDKGQSTLDMKALSNLPQEWKHWISKATAHNLKSRFANMQEALAAAHKLPLPKRS